jgi:hypothetical protein
VTTPGLLPTPDQVMKSLLDAHRHLMPEALANGHPYVIWVTADVAEQAWRNGAPWIGITHHRDLELARYAWHQREDPHGWSPTPERCIAVIAPRQ